MMGGQGQCDSDWLRRRKEGLEMSIFIWSFGFWTGLCISIFRSLFSKWKSHLPPTVFYSKITLWDVYWDILKSQDERRYWSKKTQLLFLAWWVSSTRLWTLVLPSDFHITSLWEFSLEPAPLIQNKDYPCVVNYTFLLDLLFCGGNSAQADC